ncbi:hypothetical protein [Agromyces sp. H66]|uniref:hypothetical protein n=1 Tax=Agromyces sp. H66 TaxID=2529859 RepID=UPI0010AB2185|nr:hypothetical protein [Agromyces sp. H66]
MIRSLLRAPVGPAEVVADVLRLVAVLSVIVGGIGWGLLSGLSFVSAFVVMLVPRMLRLRPAFDIAFGALILASTWSSVLNIYITTLWWDIPMHFATNGLSAALVYIVLVRSRVLGDPLTLPHPTLSAAVVTTAIGFTIGVFWELFEWFGHNFIDHEILVGYDDSLGDLLWGGLGSLLAGFGMTYFMAEPGERAGHRVAAGTAD